MLILNPISNVMDSNHQVENHCLLSIPHRLIHPEHGISEQLLNIQ